MAINDEWELYAMKGKSESDRDDSEIPSDFDLPKIVGIPQTFGFEL